MSTVTIHWLRHGHIASHRGDIPLTNEGISQARERGQVLAAKVAPGEKIHFMHAPTLRTRQTAEEVRASMDGSLEVEAKLLPVRGEWAIRNPDLYVAGQRVEMVSSLEALEEQLSSPRVSSEVLERHPFFREFWASSDRIGYWIHLAGPPGEDAAAVARRQMAFATSLADTVGESSERYVLSTHSPVLRAILRHYFGKEPGEPEYLESVDLRLPSTGPPELSFRGLGKILSGAW